MTLMLPPSDHIAAVVKPLTLERRFRVHVRCPHCRREAMPTVSMLDEPDEPATEEDFFASGAVHLLDRFCDRCGDEGVVIIGATFLRGPTELRPAIAA